MTQHSTNEVFEAAIMDALNSHDNASCVGYSVYSKDGVLVCRGDTACYARIKTNSGPGCFVVNKIQNKYSSGGWGKSTLADKIYYLSWLINDSPYAESFISKNAKECLKRGYFLNTCDVDGQTLVGGMIAARGLWEMGHTRNFAPLHFRPLVLSGCHPCVAFYLSHLTNTDKAGGMGLNTHIAGGHVVFTSPKSIGAIVNLIKNNRVKNRPFYETNYYLGIDSMWDSGGPLFVDSLIPLLKAMDNNSGEVNPFKRVQISKIYSYKDIAEASNKLLKGVAL